MDAVKTIEARRVKLSGDVNAPGNYVFKAKREPKVTVEKHPLLPPEDKDGTNTMFLLPLLRWKVFGKSTRGSIEVLWPEYDAVIVNCPACNRPRGTVIDAGKALDNNRGLISCGRERHRPRGDDH